MASDSEDEALEDLQYDDASDASEGIDEEILDALEGTLAAEESDADDDSDTDDTDDGSEDEESESGPGTLPAITNPPSRDVAALSTATLSGTSHPSAPPSAPISDVPSPHGTLTPARSPSPAPRNRSLSPAGLRKAKLLADRKWPRSFTVEAICAIPHPVSTHALASSLCMSHLITGSEDGYIRDYDIFSAVNGKVFLTAPQRHHCGVMEGLMKAAQIKCWWENPADMRLAPGPIEDPPLSPVYSLLMHSDALWSLAGTEQGHINLFTVRHEPGRLCHTMYGHRGPVSALSMQYDERGFFSAGWDGEALQWDLNTGQVVRNFTAHGAQLAAIATIGPTTEHVCPSYNCRRTYGYEAYIKRHDGLC
ncbi:hypothetical protein EW026_g3311 [Hermanssonia centrifuga]|uniref:Transcription factor spt8 beta-propeller domain-containing protein n=1 Tax=Hermanssonia centrifuga TaxID=98765 RepID=A0A4S4KQ68_9APHY|nr:hypothetical protein EW026_g3311 [Hermanssonia centrifuga]